MKKIKEKLCKICGEGEPKVEFYNGNPSKCKKCKNKEDSKKKAEKAGREYIPRLEAPEGFKCCTKCNKILPISEFYTLGAINKNGENKIYSRCKECERKIVLEHPNRNKYIETSNKNTALRKQENPEYREHINSLNRKHYSGEKGIITHMLYSAKKRALKNNLEFNLTKEDIILPTHCPLLGIELKRGDKEDYSMSYSLDRIDNSLGYVKGNVKVISMLANTMKNSASSEHLELFAKNITDYIKKDND